MMIWKKKIEPRVEVTPRVQTATLLATMAGSFYMLYQNRAFARVDTHELCREGYQLGTKIACTWPDRDMRSWNMAVAKVSDWQSFVGDITDFPAAGYVYVASRCHADLMSKLKDKKKIQTLKEIEPVIRRLEEFTDPEGRNFPAYEQVDRAMDKLYELIEWRW